jgi:hypothetical protein
MRIEIIFILVVSFIVANIYYEGKLLKKALSYKKYYTMAGVVFGAFILYYLIKKNPLYATNIIKTSNDYIKYLPIDKGTSNFISPILDFTANGKWANTGISETRPIVAMPSYNQPFAQNTPQNTPQNTKTKRAVSEAKRRFVASRQDWKCNNCKNQLSSFFQVDHIIRLDQGGSNHVDNLQALCANCHAEKTGLENIASSL